MLLFTTVGPGDVVLNDLGGRTLVHPSVDVDLDLGYSRQELLDSAQLAAAMDDGELTAKDDEGNVITTSAELVALSVTHDLFSHSNIGGDPPVDGRVLTWVEANSRMELVALPAAPGNPLRVLYGHPNDYSSSGSVGQADDIQYTQIWLHEGQEVTDLEVFQTFHGNGDIRLGIYDQTDSMDILGDPVDKVAETALHSMVGGDDNSYVVLPLLVSYVAPIAGYYWLAFTASKAASKFAVTDTYPANFSDAREASGTGTLPIAAIGLSNPAGALALVAGVLAP